MYIGVTTMCRIVHAHGGVKERRWAEMLVLLGVWYRPRIKVADYPVPDHAKAVHHEASIEQDSRGPEPVQVSKENRQERHASTVHRCRDVDEVCEAPEADGSWFGEAPVLRVHRISQDPACKQECCQESGRKGDGTVPRLVHAEFIRVEECDEHTTHAQDVEPVRPEIEHVLELAGLGPGERAATLWDHAVFRLVLLA